MRHEIPTNQNALFDQGSRSGRLDKSFSQKNSVVWSRGPSFSPLVLCKVKAGKNTFQRYNGTVPKIVHYEAHVDINLISS